MNTGSASLPENDPLSSAIKSCNLSESEWPSVRLQLREFPHSFQMQNQKKLEEKQLKRMKRGLESALSVGYKTDMETARARNLLAYALHRLDRSEDALRELETVISLDKEKTNLVTLANRAVILQSQRRFSEAQDQVHALIQMQEEGDGFEYLVVCANAELAFSYTRMGSGFSEFAVQKFQEVIPKAREPEKWLWKFGLALTKRRSLRGQGAQFSQQASRESLVNYREVLQLLMDIIKNETSQNLRAKAYAELALLLFMCSKNGLKAEFFFKSQLEPERACQLALRLDTNDNSVLCKCGRVLRYCKKPEKAIELLEKAVSIRPSATAYHHLAITYRYMANRERYKGLASVAGSHGQRHDPLPQPSSGQRHHNDYNRDGQKFQQRQHCDGARRHYTVRPSTSSAMKVTSGFTPQKGSSAGKEVASSTPVDVPSLSMDDVWVRKALYNFEKSVEVSDGRNTRAILDFATMQKNVGELEKAKENLETLMKNEYGLYDSDRVEVYQQMGVILEELAKTDCDERKKKGLYRDSTAMFHIALKHASEILSQSSRDSERVVEVYSTLGALIQDMEASGNSQPWRLGEKAKLVQLIKENGHSLELLREIKGMDRQTADEPAYHKRCIDNYVALGQYEKALAFVELLNCTTLSKATLQRFEDPQFMLKIYAQAACQALREGSLLAGVHFRSAFEEAKATCLTETSTSEHVNADDDATAATKKEKAFWDLVILSGEAARVKADALIQLLRDMCGLRVAILDKDEPVDELDTEDYLQVLTNSAMVAVMAGGKISRQNRLYIRLAVTRHTTVALIVDGNEPPELLRAHRTHVCPPELIQGCQTACSGTLEESEADAIAKFFNFLVKVDST